MPGIKQRFNEDILNDNGELMINLCTLSEMRINNTFFDHKDQYKYTFTNSRGFKSIIDYIVTSRHLHPKQILDVRMLNSANVGSDHSLQLAKITLECTPKNRQEPALQQQKINIESLWDTSVRKLYEKRLEEKIELLKIDEQDTINIRWEKIKKNIKDAANEALGT